MNIKLKRAIDFHGHLGPYLVLGLLAGELALKKLKCKKYFGLGVKVWGAKHKPKSCLIDGLQISTGATYGKGNISKYNGSSIRMEFKNEENQQRLSVIPVDSLIKELSLTKTHRSSEALARRLYRRGEENGIFRIRYL